MSEAKKEFDKMMELEKKPVKLSKRKAYMVRYINVTGGRHNVTHQGANGLPYRFTDGVWVEIDERDARKYRADAEVNRTWEYKEVELIEYTTHKYAMFTGFQGKKVAKMPLYDRDRHGMIDYETERLYVFPKDVWVILQDNDVSVLESKAKANAHWSFEEMKLPTNIEPPIKIEGQRPQEYALEVVQDLKEQEEEGDE